MKDDNGCRQCLCVHQGHVFCSSLDISIFNMTMCVVGICVSVCFSLDLSIFNVTMCVVGICVSVIQVFLQLYNVVQHCIVLNNIA